MLAIRRVFEAFGPWGGVAWPLVFVLFARLVINDVTLLTDVAPSADARIGRDFVNVWEGGRLASEEGAAIVYDRDAYRMRLADDLHVHGIYAFSYPPHMLTLAIPFGQLGYLSALAIWVAGGLALFWYAARPWLRDAGLPSWAALILPAGLVNIWAGHFGHLIGALGLLGWRFARSQPVPSGLAFAMMTVKPHIGIFVPFILALARCWHAIAWAALGTLVLGGVSIMILGVDSWRTWFASTIPFQASLIGTDSSNMAYLFMMPTVERLASSIFVTHAVIIAVQIIVAVVAIGIVGWAWKRDVPLGDLALLTFLATFLVLPYSFIYDMTAACLAILIIADRYRESIGRSGQAVFVSAFIVPLLHFPMARVGLPYSALAMLAALALAASLMVREGNCAAVSS